MAYDAQNLDAKEPILGPLEEVAAFAADLMQYFEPLAVLAEFVGQAYLLLAFVPRVDVPRRLMAYGWLVFAAAVFL